jgi:dienelactone hydrolase
MHRNLINVLVLLTTLSLFGHRATAELAITIDPAEPMVDEPFDIRVTGAEPGERIELTCRIDDAFGRVWQCRAIYEADGEGVVDPSKQPPVEGPFEVANPMALLWWAERVPEGIAFGFSWRDPLTARDRISLFAMPTEAENGVAITVERRYASAGVTMHELEVDGLNAALFLPDTSGPHPCVITMGGSEGGRFTAEMDASLLASKGIAALALAYFGDRGLPRELVNIPVETVKRAIDALAADERIDSSRLGIMGTSKGGEFALLAASTYPELRVVVTKVPSHVVFNGITFPVEPVSSWTLDGEPLPYIAFLMNPTVMADFADGEPYTLRPLHSYSISRAKNRAEATIPVERINGPVMTISAEGDDLWPSTPMSNRIVKRLEKYEHPHEVVHLAYEDAGHVIMAAYGPPTVGQIFAGAYQVGGTLEATARAQADHWPRVVAFFREHLGLDDTSTDVVASRDDDAAAAESREHPAISR